MTALPRSRAPLDEVVLHADGATVSAFRDGGGSRLEIESSGLRPVEIVVQCGAAVGDERHDTPTLDTSPAR